MNILSEIYKSERLLLTFEWRYLLSCSNVFECAKIARWQCW